MVKEARKPGKFRSAWGSALRMVGIEQRSTLISHLGEAAGITNSLYESSLINPQQTIAQLEGYIHHSTSTQDNQITTIFPLGFLRDIRSYINWAASRSLRLWNGIPLVASDESNDWKTQLTVNGDNMFSLQSEKRLHDGEELFRVTYEYQRTIDKINWRNAIRNDLNILGRYPFKSDYYTDEVVRIRYEGKGENKAEYALTLRDGEPQILVERHRGDRRNTGVHYFETYAKRHPVLTFFGLDDVSRAEKILSPQQPLRRKK